MSHVDKLLKSRKGNVILIIGKNGGQDAWWFVSPRKGKYDSLVKNASRQSVNFTDYGTILLSGWGDYPDDASMDKISSEYGYIPE